MALILEGRGAQVPHEELDDHALVARPAFLGPP
jgi:hypothetical protein